MKPNDFLPTSKLGRTYASGKTALKLGAHTVGYWSRKPFLSAESQKALKEVYDRQSGEILFQGLSLLKGTALKIAQMLSMELDIFPPAVRRELSKACHQVPPMNRALVRKIITANLGKPPEALFAFFEPTAFAAASLGQVHRATARDGSPLAVKIQYPGISATIRNDVQMIKALLFPLPDYHLLKPVLSEIEARLMEEIDYEQEARHLVYFNEHLELEHVAVPVFYPETSCQNVLSQGRLEGEPLNDWLSGGPSREERDAVAQQLHTIYLNGLYGLNCIHADPNPGNFLIGPDLTIGLVDFGCIKCFDARFVDLYKQLPRMALKGTAGEVGDLIRAFGLLGSHPEKQASDRITRMFMEIGKWFAQLYEDEYFDFGAHPDFVERGKQISYQSMALRKHMRDVNTNFVYLHRTRYGLIRLFETMKARVRMWNPYEWEGEPDGQKKSNGS